jgi:crotonobetainyl-CoA:carnitine CoA-transferase CaiB-like acyl-CoA transferase
VNDFEAAARSKHVSEREMIQEIELSDGSKAPLTSPVANFSRTPVTIRTPAQPIGAQNGEILSELGISEKEQEQLREKGII